MNDTSKFNLSISGFSGTPQVFSFELGEEILGDDLLTVSFAADGILPGSVVGSEVVFSFGHEGKKEFFNGFATGCRVNQSAGGASAAILKAKTLLHLLGREKKRAVFCGSYVEEIAKKILGRARILSVKCKLKSYHETALKVQHNESDLAFLQRLFHECGIMEFVRHSERRSELVIIDGADFEASTPGFIDIELETTDAGASFHGSGHFPVRPGMEFEAFGGTFVSYSVLHSGSQGAAYGHETESEGYTCRVTAYPKSRLCSLPRRMEPAPHSPGVMIATVEGFGDSPAALDSEGRYIIRLPFDGESHGMASSIPVHLMHNFAGEGCGVHFPLRKGTPVLVAFEDGGMEKPVILGAMPLGAHRGPSTENNSFQNIVRTSGGMELVFDDKAKSLNVSAPDSISAKSGGGHALEGGELGFEGKDKVFAKSGREMALEGGEKLVLAVGGVKISLDSGGSLRMEAPGDISVKSSGRLALQGSAVEIGGPSSPSPDTGAAAGGTAASVSSQQQFTSGSGSSLAAQGMAPHNLVPQNIATGIASQQNAGTNTEGKVKEIYWSHGADYKRLSGKSRFYTDLNIHVKTENCNDGDSVNITLKRKDGQPLFGATKTLDLTGTVSNNEAVLVNALKGYSLNVLAEITAECSGAEVSIQLRRPKWKDVHGGYPHFNDADKPMDDVFKFILGSNYDRKMFNNAGAARVSIGLIRAGMDVRKDFLVQDGSGFKKELIDKNKDNEKKRIGFIASAKNLQEWLSSVWGKADVELKCETDDAKAVKDAIDCRSGVYIILGNFDTGASGATTLWLGGNNDALGGLNYARKGRTVYFWELRWEKDAQECLPECEYKHIANDIHKKLGCVHYGNIRKILERNATKAGISEDERELYGMELELFGLMERNMHIDSIEYEIEKPIENNGVIDRIIRMPHSRFRWDNNKASIFTNIECDMFDINDCVLGTCSNRACKRERDSIGGTLARKHSRTYQATIHEIWHCIDYLAARKLPRYKPALLDAIRQDYENGIKRVMEREADNACDFFIAEHKRLSEDTSHFPPSHAVYFLDIIDGICAIFHDSSFNYPLRREEVYWDRDKLLAEYFADVGCARAANPITLKIINECLPRSYSVYKDTIRIVLEELRI